VGSRVSLDAAKNKNLHYWELNPGRPARSPSLYRVKSPDTSKVYNNNNNNKNYHFLNITEPLFSLFGQFYGVGSMNDFLIYCRGHRT
jgi:hypothetical protein